MKSFTSLPFRIKFCGFRTADDVNNAVEAGADAIGFNFFEASPRHVSIDNAARLVSDLKIQRTPICCVGVFVNPSLDYLRECVDRVQLDLIQLHGDELPDLLVGQANLPPVLKAISWRESNSTDEVIAKRWTELRFVTRLIGFLVDAFDPIQRGGTGKVARWDLLNPRPEVLRDIPLVLAGGLTSMNVAEAVRIVQPDAVDTASGVEVAPAHKDFQKMRDFAQKARAAFASLADVTSSPQS